MKRSIVLFAVVFALCLLQYNKSNAEIPNFNITELTLSELKQLKSDIDHENKIHHSMNSTIEKEILKVVKSTIENYSTEKGMTEVSWARFGWQYSYSRDTDFFTFSSHIGYKDNNNRRQNADVSAELYYDGISYHVNRLYLNRELVVTDDFIIPETHLIDEKNVVVNQATDIDLSLLNSDELKQLERAAQSEIDKNHTIRNAGKVEDVLKKDVERRFARRGVSPVNWPWFDYEYTCDWDCYTAKTRITYREDGKNYTNIPVYAEIYLVNNTYSVYYIKIGDDVIYDNRENAKSSNALIFLNNRKYEGANELLKTNKYKEAYDLFESLGQFKRSPFLKQRCRENIQQIDYKNAMVLMNSRKYDEAAIAFDALGEYSDSVKKAEECREAIIEGIYNEAKSLMESAKYEEAITRFSEVQEYQDSAEKIIECKTAILDIQYNQALAQMSDLHYEEAIEAFSRIVDYRDAKTKIEDCQAAITERQYNIALSKMSEGLYSEAITLFESLNGYSDSEKNIADCQAAINKDKYEQADDYMDLGQFENAKELFLDLGEYEDAPQRVSDVQEILDSIDREITFDSIEYVLFQGKKLKLEPNVKKLTENANDKTAFVFTSSNQDCVKVSKDGTITPGQFGDAQIRCEAADNPYISAEITVHVVKSISKITISSKKIELSIPDMNGNSKSQVAVNVEPQDAYIRTGKWSSSKESVATVDQDGVINAVGVGQAVLTFTADDTSKGKKTASCTVSVVQAVTSIELPETSGIVYVGKQTQLKPTIIPKNAANKKLTWKSSDESIATVNANGQVKGVGVGNVIISATSADGPEANYNATVKIAPVTLKVSYTAKCIAKNHVGNSWSKEFYLNDNVVKGSGKITVENGDTISVGCWIYENDSSPDVDGFDQTINITPEIMTKGTRIEETLWVTEDRGRYSGNSAEWRVIITIKP